MQYEIVYLEEKTVVGLSAQTGNTDSQMQIKIGNLWQDFYMNGIAGTVKNKVNDYAFGLYSDYVGENYTVTVGYEVSKSENAELTVKKIPAGKYAKFSVHGNMQTAVSNAWEKIWNMNFDRSYSGDFEVYLNSDMENADIDIYIALK